MEKDLTLLEKDVLKYILGNYSDKDIAETLYQQYKKLEVISRTFTQVGFFTRFGLLDENLRLHVKTNMRLGGIHAEVQGLNNGAGFILYIDNGKITMLEGYCYDEHWPTDAKIEQLIVV